ncbi:MAG TPA: hypothetical protein VHQ47_04070 [Phycisphaerae bacterium]|nr:hypothetical protein [Phycisphaerae bacterium]
MKWRSAFLRQARSDNAARQHFARVGVEQCHQLHYLQMATEKLAKGMRANDVNRDPPEFTHAAFVNGLRAIRRLPHMWRRLGFKDDAHFAAFINSLLPLAGRVERLAPAFAGKRNPNAEYPWAPASGQHAIAPADFTFPEFDPRNPQVAKLLWLVDNLVNFLI